MNMKRPGSPPWARYKFMAIAAVMAIALVGGLAVAYAGYTGNAAENSAASSATTCPPAPASANRVSGGGQGGQQGCGTGPQDAGPQGAGQQGAGQQGGRRGGQGQRSEEDRAAQVAYRKCLKDQGIELPNGPVDQLDASEPAIGKALAACKDLEPDHPGASSPAVSAAASPVPQAARRGTAVRRQ
ncbi:hypothetical protein [Streptomyces sp. NPDC048001]|uniref:hypothetical protein n=1 Tax=Streptomyces sp. NPDC048001 TaxID=3365498 RepID=UPI0037206120